MKKSKVKESQDIQKEKFLKSSATKNDFLMVGQHVRNLEQMITTQDQIIRALRNEVMVVHRILMKKLISQEDLENTKAEILKEIEEAKSLKENVNNA
jgi:hypothetical protein